MSNSTKKLVFSALGIALALVTSYIKLWEMPMGGSITLLSMLFICLIGYWFGAGYGIIAGVAFGLLQFIIDPYMVSIPQVLLDYPLAQYRVRYLSPQRLLLLALLRFLLSLLMQLHSHYSRRCQ